MPYCAKCERKLSHNYCILNNGKACHEECLPQFFDAYILPDGETCHTCGEIVCVIIDTDHGRLCKKCALKINVQTYIW